MDMAILFAMTERRERDVCPQEDRYMTDGIFMHHCAQAIPSGGKMNELQLCTSMLLNPPPPHTHKLLSGKNKLQKIHTLRMHTLRHQIFVIKI